VYLAEKEQAGAVVNGSKPAGKPPVDVEPLSENKTIKLVQ
jgi:hypothetical protein